MSKPKVFIGSSREGVDVAYAIQQNLDNFAEVTVWDQGFFELSTTTFNNLLNSLNTFEFAIFVFTPDDITKLRGVTVTTARDNIVFEIGLFFGKLGAERVYFVKPNDQDIHLPTDLLGVTFGTYNSNRSDGNLIASTSPCSNQIKRRIDSVLTRSNSNTSPNDNIDIKNDVDQLKSDFNLLKIYLDDKGWTTISFEKVIENVHPKFTEDYLMKMVEEFPDKIRRSKIKEGKHGIKLIIGN
jgi:hypothetical protein